MPIEFASWIHGTTGQIEHPERVTSILRAGCFLEVKGREGVQTWLHYAIPTPVIVGDQRMRIDSVMLRYAVPDADTTVAAIHVYDGERRIAVHERAPRPREWQVPRFDVPGNPEVLWGIGVSINLQWGRDEPRRSESWRIRFASAGCDFIR